VSDRADAHRAILTNQLRKSSRTPSQLIRPSASFEHVAIKVIPSAVADNPETLARFERESHAIAALSHPNILTIFDVGQATAIYTVMELIEGETLRAYRRRTTPVRGARIRD